MTDMPAFQIEYDHSKVEGVRFHCMAQPTEIVEEDGRAAAVKFLRTKLGALDASPGGTKTAINAPPAGPRSAESAN